MMMQGRVLHGDSIVNNVSTYMTLYKKRRKYTLHLKTRTYMPRQIHIQNSTVDS